MPGEEPRSYTDNLKLLMKNRNYILLSLIYSLMVGLNTAFGISVSPMFGNIGFSPPNIAVMGVFVVFFGVLSSMISGVILKCFRRFLVQTRIYCFGTSLFLGLAVILFQTTKLFIIALTMIIGAMFLIPIIPIGIAFCAELTWTVDETVSQGFMLMMSQLFGFVMANVCILVSANSPTYGILMLAASAIAAAVLSIFLREDIRKLTPQEKADEAKLKQLNRASIGALIIESARVSLGPRESRPDLDVESTEDT